MVGLLEVLSGCVFFRGWMLESGRIMAFFGWIKLLNQAAPDTAGGEDTSSKTWGKANAALLTWTPDFCCLKHLNQFDSTAACAMCLPLFFMKVFFRSGFHICNVYFNVADIRSSLACWVWQNRQLETHQTWRSSRGFHVSDSNSVAGSIEHKDPQHFCCFMGGFLKHWWRAPVNNGGGFLCFFFHILINHQLYCTNMFSLTSGWICDPLPMLKIILMQRGKMMKLISPQRDFRWGNLKMNGKLVQSGEKTDSS